jgi:hypothetical protein
MSAFFNAAEGNFKKRIVTHVFFCCAVLVFFIYTLSLGLSPDKESFAILGFIMVLGNVYMGRWIWRQQALGGKWFDLFRMYFLSFFFFSVIGLAGFIRFVEPGLCLTHYLESFINISVLTIFSLSFGFFISKIRKNRPLKPDKVISPAA